MRPDVEGLLRVDAERGVAVRALVAFSVLAALVVVAALALGGSDPDARTALVVVAAFCVLLGAGRALLWLALAGLTFVEVGAEEVVLRSTFRRIALPRSEVDSLTIEEGDSHPEWSWGATLPRVIITTSDRRRRAATILMRPATVARWNAMLADIVPGPGYRSPSPYW